MSLTETQTPHSFSPVKFLLPIIGLVGLLVAVNLFVDPENQGRQNSPSNMPAAVKKAEKALGPLIQRGEQTAEKVLPIAVRPLEIGLDYIDRAADAVNQSRAPSEPEPANPNSTSTPDGTRPARIH